MCEESMKLAFPSGICISLCRCLIQGSKKPLQGKYMEIQYVTLLHTQVKGETARYTLKKLRLPDFYHNKV